MKNTKAEWSVAEAMEYYNCSELEIDAAAEWGSASPEAVRKSIAQAVTYERKLKDLYPGMLQYIREKYPDMADDTEFLEQEAEELTEEQAHMVVYDWEQYDDYEDIGEEEKRAVIYGE